MRIIGLIPARGGSKRIPGKNMAMLNGKPLVDHAIYSSIISRVFDRIAVSTDWDDVEEYVFSRYYGIAHIIKRPPELATDNSHDFEWVRHALERHPDFDAFAILRPTSPFRTAETIRNAVALLTDDVDSVRAVERVKQHPQKMWRLSWTSLITPYVDGACSNHGVFDYDLPTQLLEPVLVQNACIQVAWTRNLGRFGNVTGDFVRPYFTTGNEGLDINTPDDLAYAEWIMRGEL